MPQNMFNRGMDFIRPQMMQSALGTGIPGAPSNFRKLGTIFGNVLQGNLGITKSDETGSFTFDPYQEGFKLESPGGFGIGVYGNKMSAPGEGFNVVPMGKTVEANFRFGATPQPVTNQINIQGLPEQKSNDSESAGRKFLNQFITDDKINAAQKYRTYY